MTSRLSGPVKAGRQSYSRHHPICSRPSLVTVECHPSTHFAFANIESADLARQKIPTGASRDSVSSVSKRAKAGRFIHSHAGTRAPQAHAWGTQLEDEIGGVDVRSGGGPQLVPSLSPSGDGPAPFHSRGRAPLSLSVSTFASLPGTGLSLTSPRTTCDRNHTGDSLSPLKSTTRLSSVGCVRAPL